MCLQSYNYTIAHRIPESLGGLVDTSDPVVMSSIPAMEYLFSFPLLPYPYMYMCILRAKG